MSEPIGTDTRTRVVELARSGVARNEVARRVEVSASTVSRVCRAEGVTFDRSATEVATQARVADAKARRAELSRELLDDVAHVRAVLRATDKPQGLMHASRAVSDLIGSHVRLVETDTDDGVERVTSMLGTLFEDLQAWQAEQEGESS